MKRWREAQAETITRLNQVISTLIDRMERIEIALGNLQGREVLLNEEVENEEDDNVTLLVGHSPRGGRDVGRGRGRVRRRGRAILVQKRIEREYQYERGEERGIGGVKLKRGEERGVGGVKLKISTFYGRFDPEEYLQYESKIENVFDCNNFNEERKLKLVVAEFCDYTIIWWTSLKSEWRRNYEEPIETWE